MSLANCDPMQLDVRNKHEFLLGDEDVLYSSDNRTRPRDSLSRNTIILLMLGEKSENSSMGRWLYYLLDARNEKKYHRVRLKDFCVLCRTLKRHLFFVFVNMFFCFSISFVLRGLWVHG